MQWVIGAVVVVLLLIGLVFALSFAAPVLVAIGASLAVVVLANPGGIGDRLRKSLAWWAFPGLRRASRTAVGFSALVLLYTVPAPLLSYAIVHAQPASPPTGPTPSAARQK